MPEGHYHLQSLLAQSPADPVRRPVEPEPRFFTGTDHDSFNRHLSNSLGSNFAIIRMHKIENRFSDQLRGAGRAKQLRAGDINKNDCALYLNTNKIKRDRIPTSLMDLLLVMECLRCMSQGNDVMISGCAAILDNPLPR